MKKFLAPFLIFGVGGLYYFTQACPTFYFWDSAELTAAVLSGGVPHSPGFPFFLLLAKLWAWAVPLEKAYSLNLFSAFFAAMGLALWYVVISKILRHVDFVKNEAIAICVSLGAIILMGISLTYGIQATRLEVYSLNFVGFAILVLVALAIYERQEYSGTLTALLFVLVGLFLGVHNLTIALAIPGILLFLVMAGKIKLSEIIIGLLGSLTIAILLYSNIYFLAKAHPNLNWGDPSNFSRLLDYILVRGFATSPARLTAGHIVELAGFVAKVLSRQLGILGVIISLTGLVIVLAKKPKMGLPILTILLLNCFSVIFAGDYFYENYDLHGYLVISLSILALLTAIGWLYIYQLLSNRLKTIRFTTPSKLSAAAVTIIMIFTIALPLDGNIFPSDLSNVSTAQDYAAKFISDSPEGAMIITSSYNTYFCALAYQSGFRSDNKSAIINLYDLDHKWGREGVNRLAGCNINTDLNRQEFYRNLLNQVMKKRPVFIEFDVASLPIANYLKPKGLGYLLVISDTSVSDSIKNDDSMAEIREVVSSYDIESIRTMALWLQCRGEYFIKRGYPNLAKECFNNIDSLSSKIELQ